MNAKDAMIEDSQRNQESPWLLFAKRIVRMHVAQMAINKEKTLSCQSLPPIANTSNTRN